MKFLNISNWNISSCISSNTAQFTTVHTRDNQNNLKSQDWNAIIENEIELWLKNY